MQNDKADLISSVIFSEAFGIIMTFFSGQFRMFEPVMFRQTWHLDTAEGTDPAEKDAGGSMKDRKNSSSGMGGKCIPIVSSAISKALGFLVIGGVNG